MSRYTFLIDNGHGGLDEEGNYVTAPRKMYDHGDFVFHEGVWNRKVVRTLCNMLSSEGINHKLLVPENADVSLRERVRRANELHMIPGGKKVIFISIHANAGKGRGYEIYTSPGRTWSDVVAEYLFDGYEKVFPNKVQRTDFSDGDRDKESRFTVLTDTKCPAVLTESGFMDRKEEAIWMLSDQGIHDVAKAHLEGIKLTEQCLKY